MTERKLKREYDVGDMETDTNATVHGVVMDVSPIRISKNNSDVKYFSGRLSNGTKEARMICFKHCVYCVRNHDRKEVQ